MSIRWRDILIAVTAALVGLIAPGLFGITGVMSEPGVLGLLGILALVGLLLLTLMPNETAVDIWALQSRLMHISDQEQPSHPKCTHTGLLYFSLIAEELGEMGVTLGKVLSRLHGEARPHSRLHRNWHVIELCMHIKKCGEDLAKMSEVAKIHLAKIAREDLCAPVTFNEAKSLLDDTTDIAVVTAGASLALGLPGREGYVDVQESNWSKRDPETGLIMKTATGKWIKGPNYREPNLDKVLDRQQLHCPRRGD